MSLEHSMVDYYARRAAEYERIYHKPERQSDLESLRRRVEDTFRGLHVLEVACGTGYWTEIVARSAASVVATDINEGVLAIARSKSVDSQRASFRIANAYSLPAGTTPFSAGLAVFWWSHVPKLRLKEFLQGFHRALAPGARVVFIDNTFVPGSSTPISRTDEQGNTYQTRSLDDGSQHEVLKNFPTESELRDTLDGMTSELRVDSLKYYWFLSYRAR